MTYEINLHFHDVDGKYLVLNIGHVIADLPYTIESKFEKLKTHLNSNYYPITIKDVHNFWTKDNPYYMLELNIPEDLRTVLGEIFDPLICPIRNGTLNLWDYDKNKSTRITIGPDDIRKRQAYVKMGRSGKDHDIAKKLIESKTVLTMMAFEYDSYIILNLDDARFC